MEVFVTGTGIVRNLQAYSTNSAFQESVVKDQVYSHVNNLNLLYTTGSQDSDPATQQLRRCFMLLTNGSEP